MLGRGGLRQAAKVANYCLIALAAYAAAAVVVRAASLDLEPEIPVAAKPGDDGSKAGKSKREQDDAIILKRNLFGVPSAETGEGPKVAAGGGDLRLRGVAASAERSFAVFENLESGEQNVFAVGDKVFEGPKLVAVDATGADVLSRGRKRRYEIEEEPGAQVDEAPSKKKGKDAPSPSSKKADTGGVRKTGDTAWLVDRREVEAAVANLNEVITQARAVPVMKDGQSAGFKLFQIRPGSIFEKLGLKDGDIVQRVNDTELTDPSKAVGLLEEVQSMGEIRVHVVRGGKPQTYSYTVR